MAFAGDAYDAVGSPIAEYRIPCGQDMGRGMKCHVGHMCEACKEIQKLRNEIVDLKSQLRLWRR
jgi:hypothetical protein